MKNIFLTALSVHSSPVVEALTTGISAFIQKGGEVCMQWVCGLLYSTLSRLSAHGWWFRTRHCMQRRQAWPCRGARNCHVATDVLL